ncbi:MAG: cation transporter [Phycisphaeraceae bacterium]|nr:cation transporter [Phycisphaeraceae bacterium]
MHQSNITQRSHGHSFRIGLFLNLGYVLIEAAFGLAVGSLALLADAGHNLVDVTGLTIAWGAQCLEQRASTERRTYGWRKGTVLAPFSNALLIMLVMGGLGWEAFQRLHHAPKVPGLTVIIVAGVGFFVNTGTALLFARGRQQDLNRWGVFWHMAADASVSLAVVLGGIGMLWTNWLWLDPAISLLVVVVVTIGTWRLLREAFNLVMDAVPRNIDIEVVRSMLMKMPGVMTIHDLHIWALSTTETALTAHVVVKQNEDYDAVIGAAVERVRKDFPIHHVTLQAERVRCGKTCERGVKEKSSSD